MIYSASKNAFYTEELKSDYEAAGTWPHDGIEISKELYDQLIKGQEEGKIIQADSNGEPHLVTPEIDYVEQNNVQYRSLMNAVSLVMAPLSDAVDIGIASAEEERQLLELKKYRVELMRVLNSSGRSMAVWPEQPY